MRTVGAAPSAARYGGFDASRTVWSTLHDQRRHGGARRHDRADEPARPINLGFPSGYGFTAIIVSFLGRLHPIGVFLAGLILAVTYVGGQVAQTVVHVPEATAGIFQATMLFFILASDILVRYRLRLVRDAPRARRRRRPPDAPTFIIDALVTVVGITTPILLAATGELVVEKSGVLNLGVEGMMLIGAVTGFAVAHHLQRQPRARSRPGLPSAAPPLAGAASSMLFGVLVLTLGSNQVATGLALTIFGIGLSSLIGAGYVGMIIPSSTRSFPIGSPRDPIGRVVFGYSPLVYFALIMVFAVGWFLNRTRAGLILRAVGENDLSAHSIGYPVIAIRYAAIAFGGALAGIGGSYFSMVITPMWAEQMTAGRGWIALALVVFSGWRAGRLLAGAYFFGVLMTLELYAKANSFSLPRALPVLGSDALRHRGRRARCHVGARRDRQRGPGLPRPAIHAQHLSADHVVKQGDKDMSFCDTTQFHETAAAGLALPALARRAFAAEPLEARLRLSRPGRRLWLELGAQQGPARDGRGAQRSGRLELRRERQGRRERDPDHQGPRATGQQADLHRVVRLHGPDDRGRQTIAGHQVRALRRLQEGGQRRPLQRALL